MISVSKRASASSQMATNEETGIIEKTVLKKTYEETHIEWKIPDIATINDIKNTSSVHKRTSFFINDVACILVLYPKLGLNSEFMRLFIKTNVEQEFFPECNISLKKLEGSLEQLVSVIPKYQNKIWFDMGDIIKRSQLLDRMSELAPHDVLTIVCRFKRELSDSTEPSDKTMPVTLITGTHTEPPHLMQHVDVVWALRLLVQQNRLDKLSENFKDLFSDEETCDVTLKVKDKEYKAHKSVLIARSSVFAATFKHDTLERQTGVITITDCDPDSFAVFLEYLYCGKLVEFSVCNALHLYYTSDKYHVQELKAFCVEYLMQHLTVENICEVAVFADKYDEKELLSTVQEFFNKHVRKILRSPEWECLLRKDYRLANKLLIEMSDVKLKD